MTTPNFERHWDRLQHRPLLQHLRFPALAFVKFFREGGFLQASALTFYSLIALVPVLALMLGIARGFGLDTYLNAQTLRIPGESEAVHLALELANTLLENVQSSTIAGVGLIVLIWSVLKVISRIEEAFNVLWHVRSNRRLGQRFNDYLPLIIIGPLALALSSSVTVYSLGQVDFLSNALPWVISSSFFIHACIFSISVITMTALLSWLYHYLPNCAIHWNSALLGGIFSSAAYITTQHLYLIFQIKISNLNAIYGGFVALPLLVSWIYVSWLVVLWGAALTFIHQYHLQHPWELNNTALSLRMRMILLLALVEECWVQQEAGRYPPSLQLLADRLHIPATYIQPLLEQLVDANILYITRDYLSNDSVYVLAHNGHQLTLQHIIRMIETATPIKDTLIEAHITRYLAPYQARFSPYLEDPSYNHTLRDLSVTQPPA